MFGCLPVYVPASTPPAPRANDLVSATRHDVLLGEIDLAQVSLRGAQEIATPLPLPPFASSGSVRTVRFPAQATWVHQTFSSAQDWSGTNLVTVMLRNEESFPVTLGANFSSSTDPSNLTVAFSAPFTLGPKETRRFALVLDEPDLVAVGLRDLPAPSGMPSIFVRSSKVLNTSRVGHWRLSYQGSAPARITIGEMDRIAYRPGFAGLVDEFGQFTGRDWSDKIVTVNDFADRRTEEESDLAQNPPTPGLYGNASLPRQSVAPTWRVSAVNGKKYFLTPEGVPFWMTGLLGVHDWMATMTQNREHLFGALPSQTGEDADLYSYLVPTRGTPGTIYQMQKRNLRSKYGRDYYWSFVNTLKKRLPSWGFNTSGVQCMDAMYDNSVPFTLQLDTNGFPSRLRTSQITWLTLPDPYDAKFSTWAVTQFVKGLKGRGGSRNLAGVFIDNEMSWGQALDEQPDGDISIGAGALSATNSQSARVALIAQLRAKYALVARLNSAWGTRFPSFEAIDASKFSGGNRPNSAMRADLQRFIGSFANCYFTKVKTALRQSGCNAPYLGCRFHRSNTQVVSAAADSVDALSFNVYGTAPETAWSYFNSLPKPVIISEFGFGHNDAGGYAGQPLAMSLEQRATWTDAWLRTAAAQPNIIGVQYNEYGDQPITGVADNQAGYDYGIVDIADNPDYKVIDVFRHFAKDLPSLRR